MMKTTVTFCVWCDHNHILLLTAETISIEEVKQKRKINYVKKLFLLKGSKLQAPYF